MYIFNVFDFLFLINCTFQTARDFNTRYVDKLNQNNYRNTSLPLASLAYDALWALAFALNSTNQMFHEMTREKILNTTGCAGGEEKGGVHMTWEMLALENFTYDNKLMGCVIRWNLQRTNFSGVSVCLKYC